MTPKKIALLVGSLRRDSLNRKMAMALQTLAPDTLRFEFLEIGDLPLYNEDLDDDPPTQWLEFRDRLRSVDGVLFVTPEYNRSIPGVLKNAIDVGSRPYGESAWEGKPGAIISVSPGSTGGFGANHHLRQCLVFLDVPCMQQPEAYIGKAGSLFNTQEGIEKESTREYIRTFMTSYSKWVSKFSDHSVSKSKAA